MGGGSDPGQYCLWPGPEPAAAKAAARCSQQAPLPLGLSPLSPASVNKAAKTIDNGNMNSLQIIIDFVEQLKEDFKISPFR